MTLRLGGDGAITGCTSLENPDLTVSGLTISGSFDAEKVLVASGTAAAPSYTFSGDTDNGLYYAGTNSIGLATAGTNVILIDSSGRVGVGTDSPSADLHVKGPNFVTLNLETTGSSTNQLLFTRNNTTEAIVGHASGDNSFSLQNQLSGPLLFATNATERMRIDSAGNVGIGTTSPDRSLHIANTVPAIRFEDTDTSNALLTISGSAGDCRIQVDATSAYASSRFSVDIDGTERARIDSSGNVGIGTTNPVAQFQVGVGNASTPNAKAVFNTANSSDAGITIDNWTGGATTLGPRLKFSNSGHGEWYMGGGNGTNTFVIGYASDRLTIDGSGRLLVGTSSARSNFFNVGTVAPALQVEGTTFSNSSVSLIANGSNSAVNPACYFILGRARGASVGSTTLVASDDILGGISFQGADGAEFVESAQIRAEVDGTPGANDMPGRLVFSTTADGAISPTERMRINNGGQVLIGTASPSSSYMLTVDGDAPGPGAGGIWAQCGGPGDANFISVSSTIGYHFYANGASGKIFFVENDGDVRNSNNSYGAVSDQKLKQDIVDASSQWDDIKSLQVKKFRFKSDPDGALHIGLIAQEVEQVSPGLVDQTADRDEDGNETGEVTKAVKYSVLYMKAVKALQEAMERIETLEAEVAALKAS